jgi:hypothetical protein
MPRSWLIVVLTLALGACAGAPSKTAVHEGLARDPGHMPRKILLLPADVRVHEISTGGVVEQVDAWTTVASGHADQFVRALAADKGAFELVDAPVLSEEQKGVLDQHIALYDHVAGSAYIARASVYPAWRERAKTFDYTLGSGLKPLADKTGIEAAMIISGSDYISSAGRKAAMVMGTIVAAAFGAIIVPQGGTSFLSVGVVDLRTGDLLWFGTDQSQATDLRNAPDVKGMLDGLFKTYPGLAPAHKSGS